MHNVIFFFMEFQYKEIKNILTYQNAIKDFGLKINTVIFISYHVGYQAL